MRIESPQTCKGNPNVTSSVATFLLHVFYAVFKLSALLLSTEAHARTHHTSKHPTSKHAVISNLVAACMNEDKIRPSFLFYGEDFAEKHH